MRKAITTTAMLVLTTGCSATPLPASGRAATSKSSPLLSSTPANGAIVEADLDNLILRFYRDVRLNEVVLVGPQGTMPMMVTAPMEQRIYSIPFSGLEPGAYQVIWRATAGSDPLSGELRFQVN
jgi:methionine-rich copper-binding protein CopC